MSKFLNDYVKPKYVKKAKFCYMDTENFFVYIKTDNIYKDIAEDNETRFDISNYELDTSLPKEKKTEIGLIKDELSEKIITKLFGLREKRSYLMDNGSEDKKQKYKKSVSQKEKLSLKLTKTVKNKLNLITK